MRSVEAITECVHPNNERIRKAPRNDSQIQGVEGRGKIGQNSRFWRLNTALWPVMLRLALKDQERCTRNEALDLEQEDTS
jgi:hypothetical protein